MKFLRLLIKPKWQNKDAGVRRQAVAGSTEAELVAALPTIARNDADAGVRLAALRRLDDYEAWRERSTGDADGALRQTARGVYLGLLIGDGKGVPGLDRRIAELDTLSAEELERVATAANDTALRRAAQERVRRPSLLADRAINDPDPALRQAALARIDDAVVLARIAERARKTDKTISRLAREKLETVRIASGHSETIETRAKQLCERIEGLLGKARSERGVALSAIDASWKEIAAQVPAHWRERFEATQRFLAADTDEAAVERTRLRELRMRFDALMPRLAAADSADLEALAAYAGEVFAGSRLELAERAPIEEHLSRLTRELATRAAMPAAHFEPAEIVEEPSPEAAAEALTARVRFDAQLAATHAAQRRDKEREQQLREQLGTDVLALEERLEAGDVAGAHELHGRIEKALPELPDLARHDRRLQNVQARYAELKRWQHWSNDERRKRLCDELEALPGAGLHPDAVANRVREARNEWLQLDASEGVKSGAGSERPTQGLARRFQALCNSALKPTRSYFDKRSEVRKSHQQEIEQVLTQAAALGDEASDWDAIAAQRKTLAEALRALDSVDPRERKLLAQRLKEGLTRIDARLDERAEEIAASRKRLIAQAERAAQGGDPMAAARELRDLQVQWKAIPRGKRSADDAHWKTFRAVCDEVFGKLDANRRERDERAAAGRVAAEALVGELEVLSIYDAESLRTARRDLERRWSELELRDRALDRRWQDGLQRLDTALENAARGQRQRVFDHAGQRLDVVRDIEFGRLSAEDAASGWNALGEVPGELGAALQARYAAAASGAPQQLNLADLDEARDLLVRMEYLGAIDSPLEDAQRRMDWQVSRLSRRMSTGATPAPRDELADLLTQWVALGGLPATVRDEFETRFQRASKAALAQLP